MAYKPLPGDLTPSQMSSHQAYTKRKKKKKQQQEALKQPTVKLAKAHGDGGFVSAPENQPEISKYVAPPTNISGKVSRDTLATSIIAADAAWRDKTGMSISPEMMMTILQTQQKLPSTKEEWLDIFGTGLSGPLMDIVKKNAFVGSDGNPVKTSGKLTTMYDMYGIDITDDMLGNNMGKIYAWTEQGAADWMDEKEIPQLPTPGAIRGILKKLDKKVRFDLEELSPQEQSSYALLNYGIVQWKRQWKQVLIDRGVPAERLKWDENSPEWSQYFDVEYHKYLLGRVIPYTQQTEDLEKQERAQKLLQEILPDAIIADPKKDPEDFTKNITYITQVYLADMFKTVGGPQYGDEYAKELMFRGWVDGRVPGQTRTKARWDYAHEFGFNLMPQQAVDKCLEEASTLEGAVNKIFGFMGEGFETMWEHTPWELVFNNLKDKPGALGDVMSALDTMSGHVYKSLPIPGVYLGEAIVKAEHGLVTLEDFLHDAVQNESGLMGLADTRAWADSWRETEGQRFIQHAVQLLAEDWDFDPDNRYLRPIVYGADLGLELYMFGKGQKAIFKGGRVGVNQTFKLVDNKINLAMRAQRGGTISPLAMKFWFRTNRASAEIAAERAMASHQRGAAFFEEELQATRRARGEKPFEVDDPLTGVPKANKKGKPKEKKPKEDIDNVSIKGAAEERAEAHPINAREQATNDLLDIGAKKKADAAPKVEEPVVPEPKVEEAKAPEPKVEEQKAPEPKAEEPAAPDEQVTLDEALADVAPEAATPVDTLLDEATTEIPPSNAPTFPRSKDTYAPFDLGNGYKLAIIQDHMPDGTPYFIVNILDKAGDYVADAVQDGFRTYPEAVRAAKESVKDGTVDDILKDKGTYVPPEQKYVIDSDINDVDIVDATTESLKASQEERSGIGEAGKPSMDELVEQGDKMAQDELVAKEQVLYERAFTALQESKAFEGLPDIDLVQSKIKVSVDKDGNVVPTTDPFEVMENEAILAAREATHEYAARDAAVEEVILKMEGIAASVKSGSSISERSVSLSAIMGQAKKIADEYGYDFYPIFMRWKKAFKDGFITGELGEVVPYTAEHFRREVNKLVGDMADIKHFGLDPWLPDDVISMFLRSENPELSQVMFMLSRESVTRELNEIGVWNEVRRSTGSHPRRPANAYKTYTPEELNAIFDKWVEDGILSPEHPLVYKRKQRGGSRNEEQEYVIDCLQQSRDEIILRKFGIRTIRDAHMNELSALHKLYDEGKDNSLASKVRIAAENGDLEMMNKLREDIHWEMRAIRELPYWDRVKMLKAGLSPAKRIERIQKKLAVFGNVTKGLSAQDRVPEYSPPQVPIDDFVLAKPWRSKQAVNVTSREIITAERERLNQLNTQRSAYIVQRNAIDDLFIGLEKKAEFARKRGRDFMDDLMRGKIELTDEQRARATSLTERIDEIDQRIRIVEDMLKASQSSYSFVGRLMPVKWQRQKAIQIAKEEGFLELGTGIEYKYGARLEWSRKGLSHIVHRYGEVTDYIIDGDGHIIGYEITPMRGYKLHDYADTDAMKAKLIETNYLPGSTKPAPFRLVNMPTETTGGVARGYASPEMGGYGTKFRVVRDKELVKDMSFEEPRQIGRRKARGEWEASKSNTGGINADEYAIIYESDTFSPDAPTPHGKRLALGTPGEELAAKGKVRVQWKIIANDVLRIHEHTVKTKAGEQKFNYHNPDFGTDVPEGISEAVIIEIEGQPAFKKMTKMSPDKIVTEAYKISTDPNAIKAFVPQSWTDAIQLYAAELLLKNGHDAGVFDIGMPGMGNEILVANQMILKTGLQYTKKPTSGLRWNAKLGRYEGAELGWTEKSWTTWRDAYLKKPSTRSGVPTKGRKVRPFFHELQAETSIVDISSAVIEKSLSAAENMTPAQRMSRLKAVHRRLMELEAGKEKWKLVDEFDHRALDLEKSLLIERVAKDGYDPALFDFTKADLNAPAAREQFKYNKMTPKQRERYANTQELLSIGAGEKTKRQLLDESAARAKAREDALKAAEKPEYEKGVKELPAVGEKGFGDIAEFDPYGEWPIPPGESAGGFGINATPDILSRSERSMDFHTRYRAGTRKEAELFTGEVEGRVGATIREKTEMGELLGKLAGLTEAGRGKIRPLFRHEFPKYNLKQYRTYDAYIKDFILKADRLVRSGRKRADDFIIPRRPRRTVTKGTPAAETRQDGLLRTGRYRGRSRIEEWKREDVGTSPAEIAAGEKVTGPKTTEAFLKKTKERTSLMSKEDLNEACRAGIEISPDELDFSPEHLQAIKAMAEEHGVKYEVEGRMSVTIDNAHYEVPEIFRLTGDADGMTALLKDMWEWAPDPEIPPLRSLPAMFRNKAEMIAYDTSKNSNHGNFIRHLLGLPDTEACPQIKPYLVRLEAAKHASGKAERGKYAPEGVLDILAEMEKDPTFASLFAKEGGPGLIDPSSPGLFAAARHRMYDKAFDAVGHLPIVGGLAQETMRIMGTPIALEKELPLYDKPDFIRNTSWSVKMGRKTMDKKAREQALRHEEAMLMAGADKSKIRDAVRAWEADIRQNLKERGLEDKWDEYSKKINRNRAQMYVKINKDMIRAYEEEIGIKGERVAADRTIPAEWRGAIKRQKRELRAAVAEAKLRGDTVLARELEGQLEKAIAEMKRTGRDMDKYIRALESGKRPKNFGALEERMQKFLHSEPVHTFQFSDTFPMEMNMRYLAWFQSGKPVQWFTKYIDTPTFGMERWMRTFKMMIMGTIAFPIRVMAGDELWRIPMEGIVPGTKRFRAARERAMYLRGGVDPQSYFMGRIGKRMGIGLDRTILTRAERARFHELESKIGDIEKEIAENIKHKESLEKAHPEWLDKDGKLTKVRGKDAADYRGTQRVIDDLEGKQVEYYDMVRTTTPQGGKTAQNVMTEKNEMDLAEALDTSNFMIVHPNDGHPEFAAAFSDWFGSFAREPLVKVWKNNGRPLVEKEIRDLIDKTLRGETAESQALRQALYDSHRIKGKTATQEGMNALLDKMQKKGTSAERYNVENIIRIWTNSIYRVTKSESLTNALIRGNITTHQVVGMLKSNRGGELWAIPMTSAWRYGGNRAGYKLNLPARYYQHATLPLLAYLSRKTREILFADRVNQYLKDVKLTGGQGELYVKMAEDRAAGWVNRSTFTRNATVFEDLTRDIIPFLNSYRQFWIYWTKMMFTKPLTMAVLSQVPQDLYDMGLSEGQQVGPFTLYLQSFIPFFLQTAPGEEPTDGVFGKDGKQGLVSPDGLYALPNIEPVMATMLGSLFTAATDGETLENFPLFESSSRNLAPLSRYGMLLESFGIDVGRLMRDSDKLHANWYNVKRQYLNKGKVERDEKGELPAPLNVIEKIPGMHNEDAFLKFWIGTFSPVSASFSPEMPRQLTKEQAEYFDIYKNSGESAAQAYLNKTKYWQYLYEYRYTTNMQRKIELAEEFPWLPNFNSSNYNWESPYGEVFDISKGREVRDWEEILKETMDERLGVYGGWGKNIHGEPFPYPGDAVKSELYGPIAKKHMKEIQDYAKNAALVYAKGNRKLAAELMQHWEQLTPGMVDFLNHGTIPTWRKGALMPEWYERALKEDGKDIEYWHPGKYMSSLVEAAGRKGDYYAAGYTIPPSESKMEIYQKLVGSGYIPGDIQERIKAGPWGENIEKWQAAQELDWVRHQADLATDQYFKIDVNQLEQLTGKNFGPKLEDAIRDVRLYYYTYFTGSEKWQEANPVGSDGYKRGRQAFYKYKDERMEGVPGGELFIGGAPERLLMNPYLTRVKTQFVGPDAEKDQKLWGLYLKEARKDKPDMKIIEALKRRFDEHLMNKWEDRQRVNDWVYVLYNAKNMRSVMMESYSEYYEGPGNSAYSKMGMAMVARLEKLIKEQAANSTLFKSNLKSLFDNNPHQLAWHLLDWYKY